MEFLLLRAMMFSRCCSGLVTYAGHVVGTSGSGLVTYAGHVVYARGSGLVTYSSHAVGTSGSGLLPMLAIL